MLHHGRRIFGGPSACEDGRSQNTNACLCNGNELLRMKQGRGGRHALLQRVAIVSEDVEELESGPGEDPRAVADGALVDVKARRVQQVHGAFG